MEYKIGQRVEHAGGIFYIDFVCRDIAQISNENYTHQVRTDGLSPLYKPGDQVRVKSKQELNTNGAFGGWTGIYATTVQVLTGVNNDLGVYYANQLILMSKWVEWHSGVEDKPDVQLYPNPETSNYDVLIAEIHQDKERNRAALAEVLKIQEAPQQLWKCPYYDKHTHRPCNETGSKHDIRQHSKTAHGEALPPTNSPAWEHWRVS